MKTNQDKEKTEEALEEENRLLHYSLNLRDKALVNEQILVKMERIAVALEKLAEPLTPSEDSKNNEIKKED